MGEIRVIHVVTVPLSIKLMEGQLSFLRDKGYNITLITSPGKEVEEVIKDGIQVITVPMEREISPIKDFKALCRLIKVYLQTKPHISNVGTPKAALLAGLAAFITRVPVRFYTMRGLRLETTKGLTRFILIITEKISCLCAHKVICISNSLRERAVELRLTNGQKTTVLGSGSSNGVNPQKYVDTPELEVKVKIIRESLELESCSKVIGFVGRLTADKGIVELIEAFKTLREENGNLKLLIVGKVDEDKSVPAKTLDMIRKDPNILSVGFVKDTAPYYKLMTVLAFPTHREGFGNVSIECAAASRPVVTTNVTGAKDTVIDGETGLIVPVKNPKMLVEALRKLIENEQLADEFGRNGRKRVEEEFSSEIIWSQLNSLYEGSMSKKSRKRYKTCTKS